jgi:hypothetical protein
VGHRYARFVVFIASAFHRCDELQYCNIGAVAQELNGCNTQSLRALAQAARLTGMARVTFDAPDDLHRAIRIAALQKGQSMREWLLEAAQRRLDEDSRAHKGVRKPK